MPHPQSMLFKFVGVVLQQCSKKSLVREKLDYLFSVADHNSTEDREVRLARRACAQHQRPCVTRLNGLASV